jgi:hypothetical protein
VDLTSGINLYPDLRLVDNVAADYTATRATIREVLQGMTTLGAHHLLLSLHRVPENNITPEQTRAAFVRTLAEIGAEAAAARIRLYLRHSGKQGAPLDDLAELVRQTAVVDLRLAASTALLLHAGTTPAQLRQAAADRLGLWLAASPAYDLAGDLWTANGPVASAPQLALGELLAVAPDLPVLLDGVYASWDQEYRDARAIKACR